MSGVPLRNIQNNIQYQFIRNRLEKLMPWISGSYIPIQKLSEDPPPPLFLPMMINLFPQRSEGATLGRPKGRHFGGLQAD